MAYLLISLTFIIITFILHFAIFTLTKKLEKDDCKCSDMWHKNVLHVLSFIFIILTPFKIYNKFNPIFNFPYKIIITIIAIFYYILIINFVHRLNYKTCQCSNDWKKYYSLYVSIFMLTLIFISIVLYLILFTF